MYLYINDWIYGNMLKKSVFFPMSEVHMYFTPQSPKIGPRNQNGEKGR